MNLFDLLRGKAQRTDPALHNRLLRETIDKQMSEYEAKLSLQVDRQLAALGDVSAAERARVAQTLQTKKAEGLAKLRAAAEAQFSQNCR